MGSLSEALYQKHGLGACQNQQASEASSAGMLSRGVRWPRCSGTAPRSARRCRLVLPPGFAGPGTSYPDAWNRFRDGSDRGGHSADCRRHRHCARRYLALVDHQGDQCAGSSGLTGELICPLGLSTPEIPGPSGSGGSEFPAVGTVRAIRRSINVAGRQGAKSLELRAAMSLGRLWLKQANQALSAPLTDRRVRPLQPERRESAPCQETCCGWIRRPNRPGRRRRSSGILTARRLEWCGRRRIHRG